MAINDQKQDEDEASSKPIFSGLRVLDFTWAAAGPITTKQLADNGATVVKVESRSHPDSVRLGGPFKNDVPGIDRSGFFADFNSSKLGLALDVKNPAAKPVLERLVRWADLVAESFRPGVMENWGLGFEVLKAWNPKIIMMSSSLYGSDGPWSAHPGYGAQGAALAGIHGLTGWPDRPPAVPKGAYTDSIAPRYGLAALVAALIHRDRTGEGQHVELSQIESAVQFLTPAFLELQVTGVAQQRSGNSESGKDLQVVLPCAGEDRWIAIEAGTDEEWAALLRVLATKNDLPDVVLRPSLDRLMVPEELERALGECSVKWDAHELMHALWTARVPAGVALKGSDLIRDEVLGARKHFWRLDHDEMGELLYNGPAYRFEMTPSELTNAAPRLGQHSREILLELLDYAEEEVDVLAEIGVLQ